MRSWFTLFAFIISTGCAQRMKVPVERFVSPETMGKGLEIEYQRQTFSKGTLVLPTSTNLEPVLLASEQEESLHLGLGLVDILDFFILVPKESVSRFGFKLQLWGAAEEQQAVGSKLAFAFSTGTNQDVLTSPLDIDINSGIKDYHLVYGYRFTPTVLVYTGVSLTTMEFQAELDDTNNEYPIDKLEYVATDALGRNIGVVWGKKGIKLKLEYADQSIKWTKTPRKNFQSLGAALTATF